MQEILKTLGTISELLRACRQPDQSRWFDDCSALLSTPYPDAECVRRTLDKLSQILFGMGSFTDLSLIPDPSAQLSKKEARERQFALAQQLAIQIKSLQETYA